jgi:hypothetical protein
MRILAIASLVGLFLMTTTPSPAAAAEKSITIQPSTAGDGSSSQSGGGTMYEAENVTLYDMLLYMHPDRPEKGDASALPPGRFNAKMTGYPVKSKEAFDALAAEIKKQFGVTASVAEEDRDGLVLSLPAGHALPAAGKNEMQMIATAEKGWKLQAVTVKDVAEWLSGELRKPVRAADGAGEAAYSFRVENSVFKPELLPEALTKLGFKVEPGKVKLRVLKVTKAG